MKEERVGGRRERVKERITEFILEGHPDIHFWKYTIYLPSRDTRVLLSKCHATGEGPSHFIKDALRIAFKDSYTLDHLARICVSENPLISYEAITKLADELHLLDKDINPFVPIPPNEEVEHYSTDVGIVPYVG